MYYFSFGILWNAEIRVNDIPMIESVYSRSPSMPRGNTEFPSEAVVGDDT